MTDTCSPAVEAVPSQFLLRARQTPVYRQVDVLVCGGGLAGVAAAVAAARDGAETLLVERNVVLGGNGPLAFEIGLESCGRGISVEMFERLRAGGHVESDEAVGGSSAYDPEALKYACLDLVRDAGVSLLLSSLASDPIVENGVVRGAMVENKSGRFAILAGVVIDATGDGELAGRAGAAFREPDACSLSLNARIGGIDIEGALAARDSWPALVAAAKQTGQLDPAQPDTIALFGVTPTARRRGIAFVAGSRFAGRRGWNARDLSESEGTGRKLMRQFIAFLKTVPGFESSFVVDVAGTLAIAGARQTVGEHVLTAEEAVPIMVGANTGSEMAVPIACLKPHGVDGLLVAGRAASIAPGLHINHAALGEIAGKTAADTAADRSRIQVGVAGNLIAREQGA
ncbi:FAD-dependent oxidoreductase [Sphingomonas sp. So64.6b]|uniref:FAD-dependent oxidoreductase n=1 Tax=Sphingomonas sp. So64.6b TaxID=2997354 RepID=UPI0016010A89|nr:FAD-dependent oxidoreductase [Sphingomonas sp. So64.6b]QNA86556.1 FAD-dependent oxidoreductase [Sphingomonas sp. So64.6b]